MVTFNDSVVTVHLRFVSHFARGIFGGSKFQFLRIPFVVHWSVYFNYALVNNQVCIVLRPRFTVDNLYAK